MVERISAAADGASVSARRLAKILGITDRRVRQLVDEGVLDRAARGLYPLDRSVQAYVAWRIAGERERLAGRTAADRVQELRAIEIEQRIALRDRELIRMAEHEAVFDEAFGILKSELIGLPARLTRDIELRRSMETAIDGALNRAADRLEQEDGEPRAAGKARPAKAADHA